MSARAAYALVRAGWRCCAGLATLLCACAVTLLCACTVGPDYVKPPVAIPAAYKEAQTDGSKWKPSTPQESAPRGNWWTVFQDTRLDALEPQVAISNQTIAGAEANYRQARALVQATRAGYFPTVTAGAAVTRFRRSENVPGNTEATIGPSNNFLLPVEVSWELDLWGKVRRSVESSQAAAQASAADLETARLSVQAELALEYFQLRGVDAERQLLEQTIVAFRTALELTRNRFEGGVASEVDVVLAETQLRTAEAEAIDLGVQRAQLEHAIATLLGKPPADVALAVAPLDASPPDVPSGVPSQLLERRPDIASAERQMAAANARIGVAIAAYYPSVTLTALGGFNASSIDQWFSWPSRFWAVGPQISETVFDGGLRSALTDSARAAYDGTIANYRQTVLSAFQDVEDNLAALRILADEAQVEAAAVRAARRSVTLTTNRYEAGAANYLEVVVAQAAALNNERTAVDIATRRMAAGVRLVKALGGGWNVADLPTPEEVTARTGTEPSHAAQ